MVLDGQKLKINLPLVECMASINVLIKYTSNFHWDLTDFGSKTKKKAWPILLKINGLHAYQ